MTTTMMIAISLFTYFSAIGLIFSVVWSFKNAQAYKMLSMAAGYDLEEVSASSEKTGNAMKFLLIDFTSQMLGLNLFALHVLWHPFRHGEMWAWYVMWFYPVMFAWHYFHYAKGTKFSFTQIAYCITSAAALIIAYSNFK
ncbi:MAG: hypothetical protein U0V49_00515 [Saprospiraceae bacterium]